jgi:hypothetical protein
VALTSPPNGGIYAAPASVTISANATDPDGTIARVDFLANGQNIGSRVTAPFSINWTGMATGSYIVTAVATDNVGATTTSTSVGITVGTSTGRQTVLTSQTPAVVINGSSNYELGLRVLSDVAGQITAVRFWKSANDTGIHTGRIWRAGQLVASVTFVGETASGWQEQTLSAPLAVAAGVEHVVSVNTTNGAYAATVNALTTELVSGLLRAPAGTNGVYGSPGGLPISYYSGTNYFRDIVFYPNNQPPPPASQSTQTVLTTQVPVTLVSSAMNYELGMRFVSDASGQITAIRFWKVAGEGDSHIGRIWRGGVQVASVTFMNETASGWQQQALASPLPVSAGVEHIVSVNTTNNKFAATVSGLAAEIRSGNLVAPGGANGVFNFPGLLPNSTYQNSNYFRDVVFSANPPLLAPLPDHRPVAQETPEVIGLSAPVRRF